MNTSPLVRVNICDLILRVTQVFRLFALGSNFFNAVIDFLFSKRKLIKVLVVEVGVQKRIAIVNKEESKFFDASLIQTLQTNFNCTHPVKL